MSMYTSKNPARVVGFETAMIFTGLATGGMNAHQNGLAAMRAARESGNSHVLRSQLDHAINYSQKLMDLAVAQASDIEHLKAENARLRAASATYLAAARRKAAA